VVVAVGPRLHSPNDSQQEFQYSSVCPQPNIVQSAKFKGTAPYRKPESNKP
jgi:hypothetical protein